ncbi:unnamed protein product [Clonostachys solani]|uniref:Serine hydrolase domain-containing protein n=1 Tax=Clonostachys solani TaxID=160281 RepID=A0A9P0EK43_9HYPO|nr:unnamed protein product [Clonostachys solani]
MRFLCLHGYATDSATLEHQLGPLLANLPSDWQYDFVEATSQPSPLILGSLDGIPSSARCWYNLPTPDALQNARDDLLRHIDAEGPYEGIIGFSQGGMMAVSLLLWDSALPDGPTLPFKMVILISAFQSHSLHSGVLEWSKNDGDWEGKKVLGGEHPVTTRSGWKSDPRSRFDYHLLAGAMEPIPSPVEFLLKYHPDYDTCRLAIPVVHVRGAKEPNQIMFQDAIQMFGSEDNEILTHSGGHHFPKEAGELAEFAEKIMKVAMGVNTLY